MFDDEFAKLSVEPPRRVDSLPGLRLWAAVPKWAVILPLFFVSFFVFFPLSIMSVDPAMRLEMGSTESVQGRVVSVTSAGACRGATSRRVTYAFSSKSGSEYRGGATLCEESPYYSVNPGEAIEVKYLKSDPTLNRLAIEGVNRGPPFALFFFMPVFFLAIFGSMFWPPIGEVLRARRLFKRGRLAVGRVVFVKLRALPIWPGMSGEAGDRTCPKPGGGAHGAGACVSDRNTRFLPSAR